MAKGPGCDPMKVDPKMKNDRSECANGHPMTPENTVYRLGIRGCRLCIANRKKYARERFDARTQGAK